LEKLLETILILVIPGIFILVYSIRLLKGYGNKATYMADHIFAGRVYAGIPGGLTFLSWALAAIPESQDIGIIFIYIGLGFGLLGGIFYIFQPSFMKPTWLRWLESEHGDIMPLLCKDVREMGDSIWNERIQTQADLEGWVAEVREKYGV
jgi:hypothetical protein